MLLLLMVLELGQLLKKLLLVVAVGVFAAPRLSFFLFTGRVSPLPAEEIFSAEQPGPFGKPALGWGRLGLQLPSFSSFNRRDRRQRRLLLEATVDSQHWRSCHPRKQAQVNFTSCSF